MALQKRMDHGFNAFQFPVTPRAPRSAPTRRSRISKRVEDNPMGAFELLATVAGELLLEGKSSPASSHTSTGKEENSIIDESFVDVDKSLKVEPSDQGSCDRKFESHSVITTSSCSERFVSDMLVGGKCMNEIGSLTSKIQAGFSMYRESGECKLDGNKVIVKDETNMNGQVLIGTEGENVEDPMIWEGEPSALVSLDSSTKVPISVDNVSQKVIPASGDDIEVVDRDDDENSSGCTHPSYTTRYFKTTQRIGDRRIRKILASRYWKAAPKLNDEAHSHSYKDMRAMYHGRKNGYKRQKSQMTVPFKKSRLYDRSTIVKSNVGESFYDSANAVSSVAGQHSAFQSRKSHVKLRIKSFMVPELFIEIPETSTVGSLKKTVMDAVTAVLGGGLCVGVLVQGRKVRDDTKTLQQTGISHDDQLDSLGFTLEPKPSHTSTPLCNVDSPRMLPCDVIQPLTRYAPDPSNEASLEPHMAALGSFIESDHDSAPSPTDTSTTDSKALVVGSGMSADALAVVPANKKSKRFDIGQRRIRRPFSVTEVEALVQAVEKLGTGRWRDVKIRAFDNAKHRTYVDLKDKWKTLVHTARISPQQRRGEPVPQELLDRVLAAHGYWSQQQAKQQLKHADSCILV